MRRTILTWLSCLMLTIGLINCENCGPTAEPLAMLSISSTVATHFDTVYAPGSLRPLPAQPHSTPASSPFLSLTLPINLTADSTRYIVQLNGRRDTITVFYQRKTAYRNQHCGYVLDLYAPAKGLSARTTRGRVGTVTYVQNRNGSILGGRQDTGIYLSVQL